MRVVDFQRHNKTNTYSTNYSTNNKDLLQIFLPLNQPKHQGRWPPTQNHMLCFKFSALYNFTELFAHEEILNLQILSHTTHLHILELRIIKKGRKILWQLLAIISISARVFAVVTGQCQISTNKLRSNTTDKKSKHSSLVQYSYAAHLHLQLVLQKQKLCQYFKCHDYNLLSVTPVLLEALHIDVWLDILGWMPNYKTFCLI